MKWFCSTQRVFNMPHNSLGKKNPKQNCNEFANDECEKSDNVNYYLYVFIVPNLCITYI